MKTGIWIVALLSIAFLTSCAQTATPPRIDGKPSVGSKFSKLQLGMSQNQVEDLIGKSKDCNITPDPENISVANSMITTCVYKNEGSLVFRIVGASLYRIVVDTTAGDFRAITK